jgi:(Z)-2-((N-methylformamido)methylene)-5-hydroxybutyrolactone dehydrogenase
MPDATALLDRLPLRYDEILVGGKWQPAADGVLEMPDPTTGEVFATVPSGGKQDVDAAVVAARRALDGPWSALSPTQRGAMLRRLAALIAERAGELALIESADTGRPLRDIRNEVARTAEWLNFFAGGADRAVGQAMELGGGMSAYTIRQPIGVVGAIIPSNSPFNLCCWKLGPALAAGNTIVIKPSEVAGVTLLELGRLAEQAGIPPGVVNVVTGKGSVVGSALVAHPDVKKISFTGGVEAARVIMRESAHDLKRLTLECGGKSPNVVFADADLESALNMAVFASFKSAGQSCSLGSRLLLQASIYDEFVDEVVRRTAAVRIGRPLDEDTHIGPQASSAQLAKTERYIDSGRQAAHLAFGGGRPAGATFEHGYFVEPTIFTDVAADSTIAQEEIFGPVLSVIKFRDEDEAIRIANSTQYGLTAAVWTRDFGRAQRVVRRIESGLVTINCYRPVSWMLPYGGMKLSGLGRENGVDAILDYTENKTVAYYHGADPLADPFGLN